MVIGRVNCNKTKVSAFRSTLYNIHRAANPGGMGRYIPPIIRIRTKKGYPIQAAKQLNPFRTSKTIPPGRQKILSPPPTPPVSCQKI